jgi:hypothetical protein
LSITQFGVDGVSDPAENLDAIIIEERTAPRVADVGEEFAGVVQGGFVATVVSSHLTSCRT